MRFPIAVWSMPAVSPAYRCSAFATTIWTRCATNCRAEPPANRTLIIADGVFSMDGDICPLPDLIEVKREFGCFLMIDESHASGVLGRNWPRHRRTFRHRRR